MALSYIYKPSPLSLQQLLNMATVQVLLRVALFALMLVDVHGFPVKGSKSQGQSRPSDSGGAHGSSTSRFHSISGGATKPGKAVEKYLGPAQYAQAQPVHVAGYTPSVGFVPAQAGPGLPVQAGYVAGASEAAPVGYAAGSFMPVQAAYAAIPPQSGTQGSLPEMQWVIAPQTFSEATSDPQPEGMSIAGPALPSAPALQSGETSNVVKEAELGNYQQQTEEFGYPAGNMGPGPVLPQVALPVFGVGGVLGFPSPYPLTYPYPYPYPEFDYNLLYGLYPPGTYTTFSKDHEKGKDYYQTVHYLKEHESDAPQKPGSGQHKVYPSVPQHS